MLTVKSQKQRKKSKEEREERKRLDTSEHPDSRAEVSLVEKAALQVRIAVFEQEKTLTVLSPQGKHFSCVSSYWGMQNEVFLLPEEFL